MKDCEIFSIIDLKQAFLQLPLHPSSKHLTTFTTHEGLYRFRRVPFGLASAPSVFQKIMMDLLSNVEGHQVYLDDVVCGGRDKKEHDVRLNQVLEILKTADFSTNPDKSFLGQSHMKFMGHLILKDGVKPDSEKITTLVNAPSSCTPHEVKIFRWVGELLLKIHPNLFNADRAPSFFIQKRHFMGMEREALESFRRNQRKNCHYYYAQYFRQY